MSKKRVFAFAAGLLISLGVIYLSYAEKATFTSLYIWRTDGKGDFLLPKVSEGVYEAKESILTESTVTSITATWEFEGEVKLKVSADGGVKYVPVVWGVPQKKGFGRGNRIKWQAVVSKGNALRKVNIAYTDNSGRIAAFGEPALSGFKFRKLIYIKGAGEELFNYQVKIKVGESGKSKETGFYDVHCEGNLENDFVDVRFTASDGRSLLPYYREVIEGKSPKRLASFWVKIPQLPAEGLKIYLYYGNREAEDLSQGREVFDFFDDFLGDGLDKEAWDVKEDEQAEFNVANSQLMLKGSEIVSRSPISSSSIVEYSAVTPTSAPIIMTAKRSANEEDGAYSFYSSAYNGAEHCIALGGIVIENTHRPIIQDTPYSYRVFFSQDKLIFERYGGYFAKKEARLVINARENSDSRHIGLKSIGDNRGRGAVYYDWLRVRKYAAITPSVMRRDTKEELANLAIFKHTTLASNGDLLPSGEAEEGIYISQTVNSPFPVRIIVPSWKDNSRSFNRRIDISADGGKAYKTACDNGAYYYASRLDFASGRSLRAEVKFSSGQDYKRGKARIVNTGLEKLTLDYRPGKITVVSPNGGENWYAGEKRDILWTAMDYEQTYPMKIEYSLDRGKTYIPIIYYAKNDGKYIWRVPAYISSQVKIRISDSWDEAIYDISDFPFIIDTKSEK